MGYGEYMADLLRPLEIFDVDEGTFNRGELDAMGSGLDAVASQVESLGREAVALTATGYGLDLYESLLPWRPVAVTAADRQAAIAALLLIGGDDFTFSSVERSLRGCGIEVVIEESVTAAGEINVYFPKNRGVPQGFEKIKEIINGILPCHLLAVYCCVYVNWDEVETYLRTWDGIESRGFTWDEFEVYVPEEV